MTITQKILVIDDEKEFCSLLKEFFEDEDYTVNCSHDGLDGVEKVKSFAPSIILLDMRMPGMGGIEALIKIKALTTASVHCVSAVVNNDIVEECLKNGASSYIFKPIVLEDLIQTIKSTTK